MTSVLLSNEPAKTVESGIYVELIVGQGASLGSMLPATPVLH